MLEIGIQGRVARRLEQVRKQLRVVEIILLVEVDDQHAVVAHPGETMVRIARHHASAHAADFAPRAVDFELGATGHRHHQLVIVVSVLVGLVIQANQSGVEHGKAPRASRHCNETAGGPPCPAGIENAAHTTHLHRQVPVPGAA